MIVFVLEFQIVLNNQKKNKHNCFGFFFCFQSSLSTQAGISKTKIKIIFYLQWRRGEQFSLLAALKKKLLQAVNSRRC